MAPTRVVRRTKRGFRREERVFRRLIMKDKREKRCKICKRTQIRWVYYQKWERLNEGFLPMMWHTQCWRCGKETPVVWCRYVGEGFVCDGPYYDLDKCMERKEQIMRHLSRKFPFIKRTYSKSQGREVIGNLCIHCGAYQGNFFLSRDYYEIIVEESYQFSDLGKYMEYLWSELGEECKEFIRRRVEHSPKVLKIIYNPSVKIVCHHISYYPEKTIPVCIRCHNRIHHSDKHPHLKPSQKRPGRIKKKRELKLLPCIYRGMAGKKRRIFVPAEDINR